MQSVPFWNAYANGASSIEIDVFYKESTLYVTHSEEEIINNRTIRKFVFKTT
ncbi:hypothetical protein [Flavivirga aquatica]|uniref:hypothetical protein n=1 Tax=Flavivirga aquatica TaxID=1849968 RepID=UPI0013F4F69B|nr:hypothetical protein [Flavivirga aquatica]